MANDKREPSTSEVDSGSWLYAGHETSTFCYIWKISDFKENMKRSNNCMVSPSFCTEIQGLGYKWRVVLKTETEGSISYFCTYLRYFASDKTEVYVEFSFSIFNTAFEEIDRGGSEVCDFVTYHDVQGFRFPDDNKYYRDGNLIIKCTVIIMDEEDDTPEYELSYGTSRTLTDDLKTLLNSENLSDVTIRVDEREFKVHKAILSARCSYFKGMFEHNTVENKQGLVNIEDTSAEVMSDLLKFIYTGKVGSFKSKTEDILVAADKYDLKELHAVCEETLCTKVVVDNVAELLILADRCNAGRLKKRTVDFFTKYPKKIMWSKSWQTMIMHNRDNEDLMRETFEALAVATSELSLKLSRRK